MKNNFGVLVLFFIFFLSMVSALHTSEDEKCLGEKRKLVFDLWKYCGTPQQPKYISLYGQ